MGGRRSKIERFGLGLFSALVIFAVPLTASADTPGAVGTWNTANTLAANAGYPTTIAYNGYLYSLGGQGGSGSAVYYAPLNADGSVGTWTSSGNSLPQGDSEAGGFAYNGYLYVIGGYTNTYSDKVFYAPINANGSVGAWATATSTMPQGLAQLGISESDGYAYVTGGNNGSADQNVVYYAPLNADGSVGTWTTSSNSLPQGLSYPSAVTHGGYLYVLGGISSGSAQSTVYYAPLNAANGSVGTWTTASSNMPHGLGYMGASVYNGYVFTAGGFDGGPNNFVSSAPLNADGSVGTWASSPNTLPDPLYGAGMATYNGHAYVVGGYSGTAHNFTNSVSYASVAGYAVPLLTTVPIAKVTSGSSVTVDVLTGVTGNPDSSTLAIVSGPSHGTAVDPPGTITYTPNAGYVGADSLTYRVCSASDGTVCTQGTLTFDVLAAASAIQPPNTGYGSPRTVWPLLLITLLGSSCIAAGAIVRWRLAKIL